MASRKRDGSPGEQRDGTSDTAFPSSGDLRRASNRVAGTRPVSGLAHACHLPQESDLRARIRYVEVHSVAEVAALRAAVHGESVHVQVERLRGRGPQHPQPDREAPEGSEMLRLASPGTAAGTAAGPSRHRPLPWRLLTGEREPRTPVGQIAGWRLEVP